jgi:pimeloyl-ACP methyl ester carboxylesterase
MRLSGHVVRYEVSGEGRPVVLVHGLGGSARWWRSTAESLARDHTVIVPELPGFGYGIGVTRFRLPDAIQVLGRLVQRLDLARPALVGHSLGALVCLGVAAAMPDAVGRLVLVSPPVRTASRHLAGNLVPMVRTLAGLSPAAALTIVSDVATRSPAALLGAAEEILAHRGDPGIADAPPMPALVVLGARDAVVPVGGVDWIARVLPGARVVILPGAGHVPMFDRPEALQAEIRAFIDDPGGSPARG